MSKDLRINNRIRVPEVKLIDENGEQLGVVPTPRALAMAQEKDLDLVEVSPTAVPPIAKIMDYGKYMYQKEKQEKKTQVRQKDQELKTIRIGFKTGDHDLKTKARKVDEFLKEGYPVRLELFLRGREKAMAHMGKEKVENFTTYISEPYVVQSPVKRSPRGWDMLVKKDKKK